MPRVDDLSVTPLRAPMALSIRHAAASRARSSSVWVRAVVDGHEGVGEGTPRSHVDGTGLDTQVQVLRVQADRWIGMRLDSVDDVTQAVQDLPAPARCALELALLDGLGRALDCSVLDLMGTPERDTITYSAVLPLLPDQAEAKALTRIAAVGFTDVKIKLTGRLVQDHGILTRVRQALGQDVQVRVDYNAALRPADASDHAVMLARHGVMCIEQPCGPSAWEDTVRVRRQLLPGQTLLLDDSIRTLADYDVARSLGVCDRVLLKVGKCGGLMSLLTMARTAHNDGVPVHLGCHVGETSVLAAAGRVAAALVPFATHEGSVESIVFQPPLCEEPLGFGPGGRAAIARVQRPGLGVRPAQTMAGKLH